MKKIFCILFCLLLCGCSVKQETVSDVDPITEQEPVIEQTIEINEEKLQEEEQTPPFLSDSDIEVMQESDVKDNAETKKETAEAVQVSVTPIEEPTPTDPQPTKPIKPDPPRQEPVKPAFTLPGSWSNGSEHHEYYLDVSQAIARVNALWNERIDAGWSEMYDDPSDTYYYWVTWYGKTE